MTCRFHGVLAAHATLRPLIVPKHDSGEQEVEPQLSLFEQGPVDTPAAVTASPELEPRERPYKGRHPWALLLRHVFAVDVTRCAHCRAPMRLLEVCTTAHAIARAMARAGLAPQPPPRAARPSRSQPLQGLLRFG